jgi:Carboxypeptidase regulatory-like domain/TonB-dependent Receptor Plug Domain
MTHRVRGAFVRLCALGVAALVLLACSASLLAAQEATGKIEGTVTDQGGAPIANAQVTLVGTAFAALTSDKGYYFFNNVPAGSYTVRVKFIGYTAAEVTGVRVLGGQTATTNVKLTPSAVAIGPVVIEAAANPIVPRDQVTSKVTVTAAQIQNLPVEDLRDVLNLQPGVVESGNVRGVSIRGGRPGEAAVYVDGVLVRNQQGVTGPTIANLTIGTNAVEEASVTTGAISAAFGDAESGVLSYTTKAGGQKYQGAFSYQTDDINAWNNVGFNRLEASFGGPIRGNLTFFLAATLQGQKSSASNSTDGLVPVPANSQNDHPIFVMDGVDTVVHQPNTWSADGTPTDSANIAIPRFVQVNGTCGEYGAVAAPASGTASAIRNNYGVSCQALRMPLSAIGSNTANAKLQYTYGNGSLLSLTGLASNTMNRNLNLGQNLLSTASSDLYNPANYTGTSATSYAAILNWTQNLARSSERAMAVDVNLSFQRDRSISGPLTRASDLSTRNPTGGFILSPFDYLINFNSTHTVRIGDSVYTGVHYLDDIQIKCVAAGEGACQNDLPYLNNNDLNPVQPYRMNPYGVEQSNRLAMYTAGVDNRLFMTQEQRWEGRANFDWQADRYNRIKAGGEFHLYNTAKYDAVNGLNSSFALNAYHEKPVRFGGYVEDRLDLGDVVIVGGLRYDYYDSRAYFPLVPGRISTLPPLPSDSVCFAPGSTPPPGVAPCGFVPAGGAAFDPYNPTARFVRAPGHGAWSPRVQVSFPVTENTNFRLSYAHQVLTPDFDLMFRGLNTDLSETNRNQTYGRDLDFGKTIIFEFGVRHAFSRDMVLDVAAYNKDKLSDVSVRIYQLADPQQPTSTPNYYATGDARVATNADFGNVRGVDVRLDRRFSNLFSGSIAYTLQVAKNTGSDPFSYANLTARAISSLTGQTAPPPQAILPTDDNRTHNITGSAALQFPSDWRKGTTLGNIFRDFGAFLTFRFASGLPYTLLVPQEQGYDFTSLCGLACVLAEPINSSTLPWYKNVDLRLTKGIHIGRMDWTLFAEGKNIFNFKNVIDVFLETGDVKYDAYQKKFVDEQAALLTSEASSAGILQSDGSVDFNSLGGCGNWQGKNSGNFSSGPVDCVLLERAEARYGNGDGVFTAAEYDAAFTGWYNLMNAPSRFYGPGRFVRIGAELSF